MIYILLQWIRDWKSGELFGAARNSRWSSVRKDFLILHPACEVCGRKSKLLKPLQVHHCIPFSENIFLELEMSNLITLCPEHHLLVGHLMSYRSYNSNVRDDAETWYNKIKNRPL